MNFQPLGQRILVERVEESTTTASGIIIPDNAKEKPLRGKICAISKKLEKKGILSVNDTVIFGKYSGIDITLDGKEYLVLNIDDALGVIK